MKKIGDLFRLGGNEREASFVTQAQEHLARRENVPIKLELRGQDIVILNDFVSSWQRDKKEDVASVLVTRFQKVIGSEGFNRNDAHTVSLSEREILSFGLMLFALITIPEDLRSTKFGYPKDKVGEINQAIQNLVEAYHESTESLSKSLGFTFLIAESGIGDIEYGDEDGFEEKSE